jgi:dihydroflavonol-4-reductase
MRVLVTGASGLLGANVVRRFADAGARVRILVRKHANLRGVEGVSYDVLYGDITNRDDVFRAAQTCDVIVHAASVTSPWEAYRVYEAVNIKGTEHIVQASIEHHLRLVYVSTANTIGPGSMHQPGNESSPFTLGRFNSGYINSKYVAQQLVQRAVAEEGLNAVIVNPTFMIGAHDVKPSSGQLLVYLMKNRIQWCPPGGKNFVYVGDVARAIQQAVTSGERGGCYLVAGENLTYNQFYKMANRVLGKRAVVLSLPRTAVQAAGIAGSFWSVLTGQPVKLTRTNASLMMLDNYYTGDRARNELGITYTPIAHAIQEAAAWFAYNGYV